MPLLPGPGGGIPPAVAAAQAAQAAAQANAQAAAGGGGDGGTVGSDAPLQPSDSGTPDAPAAPAGPAALTAPGPSSGADAAAAAPGAFLRPSPAQAALEDGSVALQLYSPDLRDDVGNNVVGDFPGTAAEQPVQPAVNPDAPPPLDPDAAGLPPHPPPSKDPAPPTTPEAPPDPHALNVIIVITPAGGYSFLYQKKLWWLYTDPATHKPVRGYWRCAQRQSCGICMHPSQASLARALAARGRCSCSRRLSTRMSPCAVAAARMCFQYDVGLQRSYSSDPGVAWAAASSATRTGACAVRLVPSSAAAAAAR